MIYANLEGKQALAFPRGRANCPLCGAEVIAKCGEIKIWHWAHKQDDCDRWSEGETPWHYHWKQFAHPDDTEVAAGEHRADIIGRYGKIIELQASPISPAEIREREQFYGSMLWLFYFEPVSHNFDFDYYGFSWKWGHKSLLSARKPMFFDLGWEYLLCVRKLEQSWRGPLRGKYHRMSKDVFVKKILLRKDGEEHGMPVHLETRIKLLGKQ